MLIESRRGRRRSREVMSPNTAADLVESLFPGWKANRDRVDWVDRWYRAKLDERDKPVIPRGKATEEYRELRDRSIGQWLKLSVNSLAQTLYVEGIRESVERADIDSVGVSPLWRVWQANRMDRRQVPLHRGALAHAVAYNEILPGRLADGTPMPIWQQRSARSTTARWNDVTVDEFPLDVLHGTPAMRRDGTQFWRFRLIDDVAVYTVDADADGTKFEGVTFERHDCGFCPVVAYWNDLDLDGRPNGEVEPYIDLAARLDQDTMDRLVVQRFGSWVVRTISGMVRPDTDDEARAEKLRLSIEDILVSESPDTRFNTLQGTSMDGYVKSKEADLAEFGAVTQTPPTDLIGQMINMSAEALAAAQDGRLRKRQERQHTFGESHEQSFRVSAWLMGDSEAAVDFESEVVWADTEPRSLAQIADAWGKLVTMLGVPPEAVWDRIPGVTQSDVRRWQDMRRSASSSDIDDLFARITEAG